MKENRYEKKYCLNWKIKATVFIVFATVFVILFILIGVSYKRYGYTGDEINPFRQLQKKSRNATVDFSNTNYTSSSIN